MSLGAVVAAARELELVLDQAIDSAGADLEHQGLVDWAWYRFSTLNVLVRDGASGITAASLARGLLEEAAYWDWNIATGTNRYWLAGQAAAEFERLVSRAGELGDDVWTDWLLPPGSAFRSLGQENPPASTSDAVARLGHGFRADYLKALPVDQLAAVYELLNALSHGNLVASGAVAADSGWSGSQELSALLLHLGGACCALVAIGGLGLSGPSATELTQSALKLAHVAIPVHGLKGASVSVKGRPAKPTSGNPLSASSSISRMPEPPTEVIDAGRSFVEATVALLRRNSQSIVVNDAISQQAGQVFRASVSQFEIAKGVLDGQLGFALLPYVARPIMEEAARWSWVTSGLKLGSSEFRRRIHCLITENSRRVQSIEQAFSKHPRLEPEVAAGLLGRALWLHDVAAAAEQDCGNLPNDYLEVGYESWGNADWAVPSYGVLSQFVHVTPLARWHLKPGSWHSLSAPVFSVALDALARGMTLLIQRVLPLAGVPYASIEDELLRVTASAARVRIATSNYHFIG